MSTFSKKLLEKMVFEKTILSNKKLIILILQVSQYMLSASNNLDVSLTDGIKHTICFSLLPA